MIGILALAIGVVLLQAQPEDDADLVHTVTAGDTLISIAHAYGVTLEQLLTLNDLNPEALLQIGQRLLVIRAPEFAAEVGAPDAVAGAAPETETAVGGNVESGDLPPAPVAAAAAPMRDPADISPQLCFAVYRDDNQNGMREPGEELLRDATIRLLDAKDVEQLRYTTDGATEPYCQRLQERKLYTIEGSAPPGFGLTSASRLRIEALPIPPLEPASGADERASEQPRSLLRELSGLFALGLAAVVFCSGMVVSLFIRVR